MSCRFWLVMIVSSSLLLGCGGNSKMAQLSDTELAEKRSECLDRNPTAPGKAQACENIRRECERRKEELGRYVCRHN